jgi:hypothetical protein
MLDGGTQLRQFLAEALATLRGLLLVRAGAAQALGDEFPPDEQEWLRQHAPNWDPTALADTIRRLSEMLAQDRDPARLRLHLELLALDRGGATSASGGAPAPAPDRDTVPWPPPVQPAAGPSPARAPSSQSAARTPIASLPAQPASDLPAAGPASPPPASHPSLAPSAATEESRAPLPTPATALAADTARPSGAATPSAAIADPAARDAAPPSQLQVAEAPPTTPERPSASLQLDLVERHWGDLVERVNERDGTLGAALRTAHPLGASGAEVSLGFSFKFHREWVNDQANRRIVEDVFAELLGTRILVRCVASEARRPEAPPHLESVLQDPYVQQAVRLFGGGAVLLE